jgi:glycosyltransferase involved in cell wall biosynthesis
VPRVPELVSVIVPCYNAGPFLPVQLRALLAQDYAGEYEIIVADNGSRDGSGAVARAMAADQPALKVIDASHRRGPGAARNAGARVAGGDFLAFCDADDAVDRSWLRELVATGASADLVGGRMEGARLNSRSVSVCYDLPVTLAPHLGFLLAAAGSNMGVWAEVFTVLNGFDESSRTGEDVDLSWRAQLRGYTFAASPAIVHKRLPADLRDAARRFFAYGMGDAWLYRQYGRVGMPRRNPRDTLQIWGALANRFSGAPPDRRWCYWVTMLALSCGRLAGSLRRRVIFT